jgi:hypothetical protein
MSSKKKIRFESRRHFETFELPGDAKDINFYPEGQGNIDNREHDKLTSEIMKIIKHNPRSTAFSSEYNESQIEFPDAYTTYLIESEFLTEGAYIYAERDIDTDKEELVMTVPPSNKRKANSLSEMAEDSIVKYDKQKYNIYRTSIDGTTIKLNTEKLRELLELTKAYYKERPRGVGWSDGGKPRKTKKQRRRQNKTKRYKGKTRK